MVTEGEKERTRWRGRWGSGLPEEVGMGLCLCCRWAPGFEGTAQAVVELLTGVFILQIAIHW